MAIVEVIGVSHFITAISFIQSIHVLIVVDLSSGYVLRSAAHRERRILSGPGCCCTPRMRIS
ncbi:MAG: hypothetical protein ACK55I_22790 [bacterium]